MANNNDFFDDFFDMLTFKGQATRKARLNRFTNPLQQFIKTEIAGGIIILIAVLSALIIANSPFDSIYYDFVHFKIIFPINYF